MTSSLLTFKIIFSMKKYLPIVIVALVVLLVIVGAFFILRGRGASSVVDEEANLREIPLNERPFTSLTPKEDGHWLKLSIESIKVADAKKLDYELLYKTKEGTTQGVPGSLTLADGAKVERDLLLGSESSGKFRYDDGVEEGTLTLRFRNEKGKLIGKLSTNFHLQKAASVLNSVDNNFKYSLDKVPGSDFFVTMETFGLPKELANVDSGPYGIFASSADTFAGMVELSGKVTRYDGNAWIEIGDNKSTNIGVFVGLKQGS